MSNAPKCWQRVAVDRRSPAPEGSKAQVRSGRSFAAIAPSMSSCLTFEQKAGIRGAGGGFSSFHLQGMDFVGVQIGDFGLFCTMVKLKAGIRGGAAGGFASFHLQGIRFVGVEIGNLGRSCLTVELEADRGAAR
eukprot:CAMPEP_0115116642 /NCGR_PEP_ID=MMETSP0227-20121206/43415_1 /TAXON_ID=89957 /ORGANISM="Polarella glacialis, Strain CCMP 1383" /LENGTH=133 /DNA_ID=CAMNT_0002517555 /DNA_START=352 /DNA_END=753 /DNA_ORIENTATION=-